MKFGGGPYGRTIEYTSSSIVIDTIYATIHHIINNSFFLCIFLLKYCFRSLSYTIHFCYLNGNQSKRVIYISPISRLLLSFPSILLYSCHLIVQQLNDGLLNLFKSNVKTKGKVYTPACFVCIERRRRRRRERTR